MRDTAPDRRAVCRRRLRASTTAGVRTWPLTPHPDWPGTRGQSGGALGQDTTPVPLPGHPLLWRRSGGTGGRPRGGTADEMTIEEGPWGSGVARAPRGSRLGGASSRRRVRLVGRCGHWDLNERAGAGPESRVLRHYFGRPLDVGPRRLPRRCPSLLGPFCPSSVCVLGPGPSEAQTASEGPSIRCGRAARENTLSPLPRETPRKINKN